MGIGVSLFLLALGAILTFAARPLYATHATGTRLWGLTPLADQQLAGAVMWVPAGAVYLATIAVLFVRWLESFDKRSDTDERFPREAAMVPRGDP